LLLKTPVGSETVSSVITVKIVGSANKGLSLETLKFSYTT